MTFDIFSKLITASNLILVVFQVRSLIQLRRTHRKLREAAVNFETISKALVAEQEDQK